MTIVGPQLLEIHLVGRIQPTIYAGGLVIECARSLNFYSDDDGPLRPDLMDSSDEDSCMSCVEEDYHAAGEEQLETEQVFEEFVSVRAGILKY